ncbi:MAG: 2-octaprenyl-6-methoxyphenyl hydroxylase [Rhodobacteraceae bacterium]|nr:MAG: 2-octaprenyl-6-methoxyphenyl hydroxylase [Paracoccaceae bacterium]
MTTDCDILISGGGIAGLTAAAVFGAAGFDVICVDPAPPITARDVDGSDLRTTAFLQPAQELLERCGLWERLAPHAAPLQIMRIVDAGGDLPEPRLIRDFRAADISDKPFGWNLPNWLLRREMLAQIDGLANVTFLPATATTHLTTRESEARVALSDGSLVTAKLLIAADGRGSNIRKQCNIGVKTWRYGQKALAFSVTHPTPHNNVSTEIHRTGGPFTMVPLPDLDGQPRSAIVWMEKGPNIQALLDLDVTAFEAAILERSANLFGPMKLIGRRSVWPIISQLADRLNGQRVALIAEAAHVVPPIGAQGLNMSLADMTCLLDLATNAPADLGSAAMLRKYHSTRWPDLKARVSGIDMLNRVSMATNPAMRDLRRLGLKTLHGVAPIRKLLMKAGLGAT